MSSNISGTGAHNFLREVDIPSARLYHFNGKSFTITPIQQNVAGYETNIYIVDIETGAHRSVRTINNIIKNTRSIISTGGIGA